MSYEIRNEEIEKLLKSLATAIKGEMPQGWGFTLLLHSYGHKGSLFYISSAKREDIVRVMGEFIERLSQ